MTTRWGARPARLAMLLAAVGVTVLIAGPALASLSGGCTAGVSIDGVTYGPDNDTAGNPIVVPDRADVVAVWQGTVPFENSGYEGAVGLVLGPATFTLVDWGPGSGANASTGTYARSQLDDMLPAGLELHGLYELTGYHQTAAGRCDGRVMVRFEGSPLGSPLGIVALAGTLLSALGLVGAAVTKGA